MRDNSDRSNTFSNPFSGTFQKVMSDDMTSAVSQRLEQPHDFSSFLGESASCLQSNAKPGRNYGR
jgi:hypothetical protein